MKTILALLPVLLLAGCLEPGAVSTTPEDAQALVNHIVYVKDRRGICYAVTSVQRLSTSGSLAENIMFASVDCEKAGL